jgi:taurine dioxygenase
MKVSKVTARFGAEIGGIDLTRGVTDRQADDLYALLLEHAVLLFRDQALSSQAHVDLGRTFGRLAPKHPFHDTPDGFENIMIIVNDADNPPEATMWHTDQTFDQDPPFVSLLHAVTIPEAGGDTLFADLRAVHDALSEPIRTLLSGLEAEHRMDYGFRYLHDRDNKEREAIIFTDEVQARNAVHPCVKLHPSTGRPIVYLNRTFTKRIRGLTAAESDALLNVVYGLVDQPCYQMRVRWQPGMLAIWDNWSTQHYATGDHYPAQREMRRVTAVGDRRVGPFSTEYGSTAAAAE